jgi:Fe2+ or Zn2+ uptake regulation protein
MHTISMVRKLTRKSAAKSDDSKLVAEGSSNVDALSREILDYLKKHPEASDTLEGIATWWLQKQRIENLVDEVAKALELLIENGTITSHRTLNGTSLYKIKKK